MCKEKVSVTELMTKLEKLNIDAKTYDQYGKAVYEYLKEIQIEESPTKAIDVLKSVDSLVQARVKERENTILKSLADSLELDYAKRTVLLESSYATKEAQLKQEYAEYYEEHAATLKETETQLNEIRDKLNETEQTYLRNFVKKLRKNTYNSSSSDWDTTSIFAVKKVKIKSSDFLEHFETICINRGYI